jgi:anti-sigma factor RsiW
MMAACEPIRNDLKAFLDRELPLPERVRVRLHLARCASCREEIRSMNRISNALRSSGSTEMEGKLRSKLVGLIPTDAREAAAPGNRKRPLMIAWGVACAGALAWFAFQMQPRLAESLADRSVTVMQHVAGSPTAQQQVAMSAPSAPPGMMGGMAASGSSQTLTGAITPDVGVVQQRQEMMKGRIAGKAGEDQSSIRSMPKPVESWYDSFGHRDPNSIDVAGGSTGRMMAMQRQSLSFGAHAGTELMPKLPVRATRMVGNAVVPKETTLVTPADPSAPATATPQRDIHREGEIGVEVARIEESSNSVEQWTKETSGGYVASNELTTGDDGVKTASLLIKVPVNEFDGMMKKIAGLGNVTAKHVSGEDLTERISDTGQEKKSLQEQIDEEAAQIGKIKNHWERQDARNQLSDLKIRQAQAQGRLEMLKKMATLSSISVDLHEKAKAVAGPKASGGLMDEMSDTLHSAGQSIAEVAKLPLTLLIWIIAYSPLWILLALGYRYIIRS